MPEQNYARNRNSQTGNRKVVKPSENTMLKKRKLWVFDVGETPTGKEIKAMLDRQLSSDRYEIRNTFSQSFETMQNSKRAESGNINTQSFKTAEDNKRDHKVGKHKDSKEQVSCNNADKEEQTSKDCGNKEPEWYEI